VESSSYLQEEIKEMDDVNSKTDEMLQDTLTLFD
jgi:hypothetical protein